MIYKAVRCRFHVLLQSDFFLFAAVWVLCIIIGICLADAYAYNSGRLLITSQLFPATTLMITVVPVLVVGLSRLRGCPLACYLVIVTDALSRGFCGFAVFLSYGSAGWLVRGLVQFSGICTSVMLWWLLLRSSDVDRCCFKKDFAFCMLSAVFISAVDVLCITPFLRELTMYI